MKLKPAFTLAEIALFFYGSSSFVINSFYYYKTAASYCR